MALSIPVAVFAAALFIAVVGFADDLKSIPVLPRLLLQAVAVGAILFTAPGDLRIVPACPLWIERGLLLLAGLWFVNLVNFMDGLDWMTVAEVVPITGAMVDPRLARRISAAGDHRRRGALRRDARALRRSTARWRRSFSATSAACRSACCSAGACCNWPIISNSPPHCCCRCIICSDATVTLLRRMVKREPFWAAHRSHFYQRATDNGFTVSRVVSEVFALNIGLAALAIGSIMAPSVAIEARLSWPSAPSPRHSLLHRFARPRA